MRGTIITTTGDTETRPISDEDIGLTELEGLQEAVGGYIEMVPFTLDEYRLAMFLNEDGKLKGLPPNPFATALVLGQIQPNDYIAGDVVITGPADANGDTTSIPPEVAEALQAAARELPM